MPTESPSLCWQGWRLSLPPEWTPLKIEGDWHAGSMTIADFHAVRLALRWRVPRERLFDASAWARRAVAAESGEQDDTLAKPHAPSAIWEAGHLFSADSEPAHDTWAGQSRVSKRTLEVIHSGSTPSKDLVERVLPFIADAAPNEPQQWTIFDLRCTVPTGWTLREHRLNAGDLSLTFGRARDTLIVRQVGPAELALERQSLLRWVDVHRAVWRKLYRPSPTMQGCELPSFRKPSDLDGAVKVWQRIDRRRRFFYLRHVPRQRSIVGLHDVPRDRLVIVDSSVPGLEQTTLETIGNAKGATG